MPDTAASHESVEADTAAAVAFLQWWRPRGVLTLTAIPPDGSTETRSWQIGDDPAIWHQVEQWTEERQARKNIYFTANECRLVSSKPAKEDIVGIWAVFTDADPDPDAKVAYETRRQRLLEEMLPRLTGGELPASAVLDSGHGVQALWRFAQPMTDTAAFEALNKPFSEVMGSKGVYNVDRLLRVPGTVNLIGRAKLAKGYPTAPTLARVIHLSEAVYSSAELGAFAAGRQREDPFDFNPSGLDHSKERRSSDALGQLPASLRRRFAFTLALDEWLAKRWRGDTTGLKDTSRSAIDMSLGAMLKDRGYGYQDMVSILCAFPHGAGAEKWAAGDTRYFQRIWERADQSSGEPDPAPDATGLCLSLAGWLGRDIPAPDFVLGQWLSTTSRAMLVAPTGLGKTNLCLAIGFAIASGQGFLHWQASRSARVLYVDGEMSRRLLKVRLVDAARRCGATPDGLFVLCRDDVESLPPLNTTAGQAFMDAVLAETGAEIVIFDNIMSLLTGDMKDEESWQETLPWAKDLTRRNIGQLWVHHTGHDETRSYGTKTREWQLDTVLHLERLERADADVAFTLTFKKARERTPLTRADFEPAQIALVGDRWRGAEAPRGANAKPPSPGCVA